VRVLGLDHVVLLCRDVDASLAYYCGQLGLESLDVKAWRQGKAPFPSVRVSADTIIDLMPGEPDGRNADHICLVIETTDLHALAERSELNPVKGPVQRSGAHGLGWSLYVVDPDLHLIELKHYGADARGGADIISS